MRKGATRRAVVAKLLSHFSVLVQRGGGIVADMVARGRSRCALVFVGLVVAGLPGCAQAAAPSGLPPRPGCLRNTTAAAPLPRGLIALEDNGAVVPSASVVPRAILRDRSVSGVLLYVDWSALEPGRGAFSPSIVGAVDDVFCEAERHDKFVVLDLLPGFDSPPWAIDATANPLCKAPTYATGSPIAFCFQYSYSGMVGPRALPIPWNTTYLDNWFQFLRVMAHRYGRNPEFSMIGAAGPTSLSEEMSLPDCPCTQQPLDPALPATYNGMTIGESDLNMWTALGYDASVYEAAWRRVYAAYARIFPRQMISFSLFQGLPIPDASESDATLDAVEALGAQTVGASRFAFEGDGIVASAESSPPSSFYHFVEAQDGRIGATGFQTPNDSELDPHAATPLEALQGALEAGVAASVRYLEFYDTEVLDPSTGLFAPGFRAMLRSVLDGWPRPATGPPTAGKAPKPCGHACL